jgi:D-beta-D-heptose 7-phosphate kinase/D-beta-D-heptose 1-phosphate adenosyltransferase
MSTEYSIVVSGGFDPLHTGHITMMRDAKEIGDELIVVVNNGHWLREKKGFELVPGDVRMEVIQALEPVDDVHKTSHQRIAPGDMDMSICSSLKALEPDLFGNGGDRKEGNIPEYQLCEELGIELVFGLGEEKEHSSTKMFYNALRQYGHENP